MLVSRIKRKENGFFRDGSTILRNTIKNIITKVSVSLLLIIFFLILSNVAFADLYLNSPGFDKEKQAITFKKGKIKIGLIDFNITNISINNKGIICDFDDFELPPFEFNGIEFSLKGNIKNNNGIYTIPCRGKAVIPQLGTVDTTATFTTVTKDVDVEKALPSRWSKKVTSVLSDLKKVKEGMSIDTARKILRDVNNSISASNGFNSAGLGTYDVKILKDIRTRLIKGLDDAASSMPNPSLKNAMERLTLTTVRVLML